MRCVKLALFGLFAFAAASSAQAQIYTTPFNSTTSGGSVNALADFTLSNGKIVVVLKNLLQNPTSDAQMLNGLTFGVSGATSTGTLTTSNAGQISVISGGGAYTVGVSDPLTRWKATESGTNISLTTLTGGAPNELIIGADSKGGFDPNAGGKYTNANPSITNNHNPSILGSAMFTIDVAGVTAASTLNNVTFDFGTAAGSNTVAGKLTSSVTSTSPAAVPEPDNVALLIGLGVSGVGFLARRRRQPCPVA